MRGYFTAQALLIRSPIFNTRFSSVLSLSVLLSASVKRFGVFSIRDLFKFKLDVVVVLNSCGLLGDKDIGC